MSCEHHRRQAERQRLYRLAHRDRVLRNEQHSRQKRAGNCQDCGSQLGKPGALRCAICAPKARQPWNFKGRGLQNGYVWLRLGDGRRVWEHRHVWEAAHGALPEGCVIHHKNGDRADNRLDNLEA